MKVMKAPKMGPKALTGSAEAKRLAAVILEVLSGTRDTETGSQALGVTLSRYYVLETRALQGLIAALEPRPKGRRHRPEDELAKIHRDKERLERDLARAQALVRAAQRSMGIPSPAKESKLTGKRRRRRVASRAMRTVMVLRSGATEGVKTAVHLESGPTVSGA